MWAQNNQNEGGNTVFYVLFCLVNSKTNSFEIAENLLMQNTECMKSSQANVDTSQRQSLKQSREYEEATSDYRNVGTLIKRKGSALLLSLSRLKLRVITAHAS